MRAAMRAAVRSARRRSPFAAAPRGVPVACLAVAALLAFPAGLPAQAQQPASPRPRFSLPALEEDAAIRDLLGIPPAGREVEPEDARAGARATAERTAAAEADLPAPWVPDREALRGAFARGWFSRPFEGRLPLTARLPQRPSALAGVSAATGPEISAAFAAVPSREALLWAGFDRWDGRIENREHLGLRAGGALVSGPEPARMPGTGPAPGRLRLSGDFAVGRESWQAWGARPGAYDSEGEMEAWRARGRAERTMALAGGVPVLAAAIDAASVTTSACAAPGCASRDEETARWLATRLSAASTPLACDLSRWVRSRSAGARLAYELEIGLVSLDDAAGSPLSRGRWRGSAGLALEREAWSAGLGAAGGGEGSRHAAGPALELRLRPRAGSLLAAFSLSPEVLFAEETLALEEPLAPGDLLLPPAPLAESLPAFPEAPALLLARRQATRAWPRAAAEVLWHDERGWVHAEATYARLRDPLDWASDSLGASGSLYRAVAGADARFGRIALSAARRITGALGLEVRYRWADAAAEKGEPDPAFLPAHRLRADLSGESGAWRWGLRLDARGSADAGAGRPRLPGWVTIDARGGRRMGPGTLWLTIENLLGEEIALRPGEVADGARLGLAWQQRWPAVSATRASGAGARPLR